MVMEPPKKSSSAALWLGLIGLFFLACGGGLWYFVSHGQGLAGTSAVATTSTPPTPAPVNPDPVPQAQPTAPTKPEEIPPNPDFAKKAEEPPPNPDFAKKPADPAPSVRSTPPNRPAVHDPGPKPREQPSPPVTPAVRASNPTSGRLHANVEVGLNGEVVFENLPSGRLRFIYDHSAWRPTISHQANGTQTLVMRSLKGGIQRTCDVTWEIVE